MPHAAGLLDSVIDILILKGLQTELIVFTAKLQLFILITDELNDQSIYEKRTEVNRNHYKKIMQVHELSDRRLIALIEHIHPDQIKCSRHKPEISPQGTVLRKIMLAV